MQDGECQHVEQLCFTPSLGLLKVGCLLGDPLSCLLFASLCQKGQLELVLGDTSGQATGINMKTLDLDLRTSGEFVLRFAKGTWVSVHL